MADPSVDRPLVGVVAGDPNGIGHEILVQACGSGELQPYCRPVVIGDPALIADTIGWLGAGLEVRAHASDDPLSDDVGCDPKIIDVWVSALFAPSQMVRGEDRTDAGAVSGRWLEDADRLAKAGVVQATVMGPISAKAMDQAGALSSIASHKLVDPAYLLLRSGPLIIAHLTDHVPLGRVSSAITEGAVLRLIQVLDRSLKQWGVDRPNIGVAGFNPHATGEEEKTQIAPAIEEARRLGIEVEGPISPDSIFRHCIEGRYSAVVAMYHDQGHIAIKTWGFSGNNVVFLGPDYPHTTVAHGVAYDLAGTGKADYSMLRNAVLNAASLAAGRGFHGQ